MNFCVEEFEGMEKEGRKERKKGKERKKDTFSRSARTRSASIPQIFVSSQT